MKKLFSLLLAVAAVFGCAHAVSLSPYTGTWYLRQATIGGKAIRAAGLEAEVNLVLTDDGIAALSNYGEPTFFFWNELRTGGIVLTDGMDGDYTASLWADGTLRGTTGDGVAFIFGREPAFSSGKGGFINFNVSTSEAFVLPSADGVDAPQYLSGQSIRDFAGRWAAVNVEVDGIRMEAAQMGAECRLSLNIQGSGSLHFDGRSTYVNADVTESPIGTVCCIRNDRGMTASFYLHEDGTLVSEDLFTTKDDSTVCTVILKKTK